MFRFHSTLLIACLLCGLSQQAPADELFAQLPNTNVTSSTDPLVMPTKSYSGYVDVTDTKSLHYVFVESESHPDVDPLIVWLDGGPGCSSLFGFMYENGPWIIDYDGNVEKNPYPWN